MKKISKRIMALFLTTMMVSGSVVSADVNSDIKSAKTLATEARNTVEKYKSNLTTLKTQRKEINSKLSDAEKKEASLRKTYQSEVQKAKQSSEFFNIQKAYDIAIKDEMKAKNKIELCYADIDYFKAEIEQIKGKIKNAVEEKRKAIETAYEDLWLSYNGYKESKEEEEKGYKYHEDRIEENQTKLSTYKKQLKTAQANYDAVAGQYNEGMFGFLEWEQTAYPKYASDAKKALNILKNCRDSEYTKKGDPEDATYLANVLYMEEFLNECNTLRQNDPNYNKKGEVLKVNNVAMAIAQSNANYSGNAKANADETNVDSWGMLYTDQFPVVQLFSTYWDPYGVWYHDERKVWEAKGDDWEFWSGHYTGVMEDANPNTPTGLANSGGLFVQIFTYEGTEYANGPLIPISEYFSMLKEYNNLVYPKELDKKIQDLKTNIYKAEQLINNSKSALKEIQKRIDKYAADMESALARVKKQQAYKDYQNMDKELDKVRAEYNKQIKEREKQVKSSNAELEELKSGLKSISSSAAKARKTYESKLKKYPDVEKAYKAHKSAQENLDNYKEKLRQCDDKISNLKDQLETAEDDFDKKLANYKKILKDNGLKYENNKLDDPDPEPVVANPVTSITLKSRTSTTVMAGKQVTIAATVKPANANKNLTWSCSNKNYATVNSNGLVTTKPAGAGKTVIIRATATDGSKKTNTIKLNIVKDGVTSLAIKGNTSMNAGSSMKLTATVKASGNTANKEIGWKSSNKDAANVSSSGVVYANEAGRGQTVTITAYTLDGTAIKKSINITIK